MVGTGKLSCIDDEITVNTDIADVEYSSLVRILSLLMIDPPHMCWDIERRTESYQAINKKMLVSSFFL